MATHTQGSGRPTLYLPATLMLLALGLVALRPQASSELRECKDRLKRIGIALRLHLDAGGSPPPPDVGGGELGRWLVGQGLATPADLICPASGDVSLPQLARLTGPVPPGACSFASLPNGNPIPAGRRGVLLCDDAQGARWRNHGHALNVLWSDGSVETIQRGDPRLARGLLKGLVD